MKTGMSKRRVIALLVGASLTVGACATVAVVTRDGDEAVAQEESPVFETTTSRPKSSTSSTTSTTVSLDPLPVPEAPPADPHARVSIVDIGAISIPKIGINHRIFEGITLTVINKGPGHWPGSAMPGARGNTVFPGHRTTYSHPFGDIDKLVGGDEVIFDMPDGTYVYHVREILIVAPTDLWVVDQTDTATFTLVACHPKGSARQRIVAKGDLVASYPK